MSQISIRHCTKECVSLQNGVDNVYIRLEYGLYIVLCSQTESTTKEGSDQLTVLSFV